MRRGFLLGLMALLGAAGALAADPPTLIPIVFTALRDNAECIHTVLPDGKGERAVTEGSPNAFMAEMNKQGTLIAYCRDVIATGSTQVFVANLDGSEARMVTKTGDNYHPSFSPDGARLVFHSTRDATRELYVINIDGTGETRITDNAAQDRDPVFGPDGRIYFKSDRDGNWDIYAIDVDGTNALPLTRTPEDEFDPAVSPDGKLIAFARVDNDVAQLFVMTTTGTEERRVTSGQEDCSHPSFSPDSRQLVYQQGPLYDGEIHLINLDGTGDTGLSISCSYSPAWGK